MMVATPIAMDAQYPLSASLPASPGQSDFLRWMKEFISEGVYMSDLSAFGVIQRGAGADMSVDVLPGRATIRGTFCEKGTTQNLAISPNATGLTRIDLIVIRLTAGTPVIQLAVVEGIAGAGAPSLTRTSTGSGVPSVWEVLLAQVSVASGAASIVTANITDLRQPLTGKGFSPATAVASASALVLPYGKDVIIRVAGTTTITSISVPWEQGAWVILHFTSAGCQVTHNVGAGIQLADNRNYVSGLAVGSFLGLMYEAGAWREMFRVGEQLGQNLFLAGPIASAGQRQVRALDNSDVAVNLLTHNKLAQATQNLLLASPNGSTGNITARALVNADIPVNIVGHNKLAQATQNLLLASPNGSTGDITARALVNADIPVNIIGYNKLAQGTQNLVLATPNGSTGDITARALVTPDLPVITQRAAADGTVSGPTTTATSFVDVEADGVGSLLRKTLTINNGSDMIAIATMSVSHGTANQPIYGRLVDDVSGGARGEVAVIPSDAGELAVLTMIGYWTGLSAAAHTISAQWRVDAGTGTNNGTRRHLFVMEIRK